MNPRPPNLDLFRGGPQRSLLAVGESAFGGGVDDGGDLFVGREDADGVAAFEVSGAGLIRRTIPAA